MAVVSR